MKSINIKSKSRGIEYIVNITLRTRITFISDPSSTGKTFVRKLATKESLEVIGFDSSHLSLLNALIGQPDSRFTFKDKLVIIDNAEKLLHELPNLIDCINYDRDNYYLLFLRQTSFNIEATPNSQARLAFNKETNTFNIEYIYEDGVWA